MSAPFAYAYTHTTTEATTGYFSCEPVTPLTFDEALTLLEASPLDEFLHTYALRQLATRPVDDLRSLAAQALGTAPAQKKPAAQQGQVQSDKAPSSSAVSPSPLAFPIAHPVLAALLLECALLHEGLAPLQDLFQPLPDMTRALAEYSPLIFLRWSLQEDAPLHTAWSALFAANITQHSPLPHPQDDELPLLYPADSPQPFCAPIFTLSTAGPDSAGPTASAPLSTGPQSLAELHAALKASPTPPPTPWSRPPAQETATRALELLVENGVIAGGEMRHEASLSPIALLRKWQVDIAVQHGRHNYSLRGQATTYGRGLSVADARASYAMEMVERASAYASVNAHGIVGTSRPMPLVTARYSELLAQGTAALDPNTLPLEVPYTDSPLHWLEAYNTVGDCVLVPAQAVYLFCNLDETSLMSAPGSTGLASGNTLAEAKVAALTEIFERDAEATRPFDKRKCFRLRSNDPRLQALLDDYEARGIQVQFQDISTEFGIPCYQCFVRGHKGALARATGAGLKGARAALAALTEVPYPYPHGPRSGPALPHLPERVLEELSDYSLESPTRNLALLENMLHQHGLQALYVELTRNDLEFPVVRAIVPHLELGSEFDRYARIRPRLFYNYLSMFTNHTRA